MSAALNEPITTKGERTREHILETAFGLFATKGYTATTMRDIAAAAGCSLGLTYRYFAQKEALVVALYQRIARDLMAEVEQLPSGLVADRFVALMQRKFALLTPYRTAFGALFGAALTPDSGVAVLGPETAHIRSDMTLAFQRVVLGATDAPRAQQARDLALLLYAAHLLLVLVWLHEPGPAYPTTLKLLELSQDTLRRLRWFLRLPSVAALLARLAEALTPILAGNRRS